MWLILGLLIGVQAQSILPLYTCDSCASNSKGIWCISSGVCYNSGYYFSCSGTEVYSSFDCPGYPCPAGQYNWNGGSSSSCYGCRSGSFSSYNSTSCKPCPPGSFSPDGASSCTSLAPLSCSDFRNFTDTKCEAGDLAKVIESNVVAGAVCVALFVVALACGLYYYVLYAPHYLLPGVVSQATSATTSAGNGLTGGGGGEGTSPPPTIKLSPASPMPIPLADYASMLLTFSSILGGATVIMLWGAVATPWYAIKGGFSVSASPFLAQVGRCGLSGNAVCPSPPPTPPASCTTGCVTLTYTGGGGPLAVAGSLLILASFATLASCLFTAFGAKAVRLLSTLPFKPSPYLNIRGGVIAAWVGFALIVLGLIVSAVFLPFGAEGLVDEGLSPGSDMAVVAFLASLVHAILLTVAATRITNAPIIQANIACARCCRGGCCGGGSPGGGGGGMGGEFSGVSIINSASSSSTRGMDAYSSVKVKNPILLALTMGGEGGAVIDFKEGAIGFTPTFKKGKWVMGENIRGQAGAMGFMEGDEILAVEGMPVGGLLEDPKAPGTIPGVLGKDGQGPLSIRLKYAPNALEKGKAAVNSCEQLRSTSRIRRPTLAEWVAAVHSNGRALHSHQDLQIMRNAMQHQMELEKGQLEAEAARFAKQAEEAAAAMKQRAEEAAQAMIRNAEQEYARLNQEVLKARALIDSSNNKPV